MTARSGVDQTQWREQLDQLYNNHHGWLHGWLSRKLGCHHRAADLAQDTFVRLLAREEAISLREPRAFLTTVARRVLSNHWRRERLEQAYLETLARLPQEQLPTLEERMLLLETLLEIDRRLDGLPVPVKRAFLYSQLDGLTHAQIGERLSLSISTVKRYLVRAGAQCYFALAVEE
jgi:RNA polymerase sigma-70 factor (ECF subfamily)